MALGLAVAGDIANGLLTDFIRGDALSQTTTDKPTLAWLNSKKKPFPGGKDNISFPVQGSYMSDTPGLRQGYSEDDALTFAQAANLLRTAFPWKEIHYGLVITWTEMKKDGLTVTDSNKVSRHSERDLVILTDLYTNRLMDYKESIQRLQNDMLWRDGSTDSKIVPGILSIITDTPATGTTGGLNRATYPWWRHQAAIGSSAITPSAQDQTLSKYLRSLYRRCTKYGGKPVKAVGGEVAIEALEMEVAEKGVYTQTGFMNEGATELGMAKIRMGGLGTVEWDPTLDDMGMGDRLYFFGKRLQLRPMDQEDMKVVNPERPYQYAIYLQSTFWTGGLCADQLTDCAVVQVNFNPGQ